MCKKLIISRLRLIGNGSLLKMKKPTQKALANHIGITEQGLSKMKRDHPKKFKMLWMGWVEFVKDNT